MRGWHATIAVLVTFALILQVVIAVRVSGTPHQVSTGVLAGSSLPGRIIRVFSFFTIQSNLLCGIVSAQLAVQPDRDGRAWRALRVAALCGITVTGVVYSAVLADVYAPHGAGETVVNSIVHYIVPITTIVGWFAFGPRPRIDRASVLWSLIFPVGWLAYTLARGAIWHWYPYPFVNVTRSGYAQVSVNALLVTIVFAVVVLVFAVGDRVLPAVPRWPDAH